MELGYLLGVLSHIDKNLRMNSNRSPKTILKEIFQNGRAFDLISCLEEESERRRKRGHVICVKLSKVSHIGRRGALKKEWRAQGISECMLRKKKGEKKKLYCFRKIYRRSHTSKAAGLLSLRD